MKKLVLIGGALATVALLATGCCGTCANGKSCPAEKPTSKKCGSGKCGQ